MHTLWRLFAFFGLFALMFTYTTNVLLTAVKNDRSLSKWTDYSAAALALCMFLTFCTFVALIVKSI